MAKDNEKKVSGNMSSEELENVAGGWCVTGGKSMPKEVVSMETLYGMYGDYKIITEFSDGSYIMSYFDSDGKMMGTEYENHQ